MEAVPGVGPARAAGQESAALAAALDRVGDRWSLLLVHALGGGPAGYSALQAALPGISPTVLSQRLKRLEADGVVHGRVYSRRPLRLAYELTPGGSELLAALRLLAAWGTRGDVRAPAHPLCGTPMEVRWWCPTCGRSVDDADEDELHHL